MVWTIILRDSELIVIKQRVFLLFLFLVCVLPMQRYPLSGNPVWQRLFDEHGLLTQKFYVSRRINSDQNMVIVSQEKLFFSLIMCHLWFHLTPVLCKWSHVDVWDPSDVNHDLNHSVHKGVFSVLRTKVDRHTLVLQIAFQLTITLRLYYVTLDHVTNESTAFSCSVKHQCTAVTYDKSID